MMEDLHHYYQPIVGGLVFLIVVAVKKIGENKEFVSARNSEKLSNHSFSLQYLIRATYHHSWVKGIQLVHGVGGLIAAAMALIDFFWFIFAGHRGPDVIPKLHLAGLLLLSLGQLTPFFRRKLNRLGQYQLAFHKTMALAVGYGFGANSIYAKEIFDGQVTSHFDRICTYLSLVMPLASLAIYFVELYKQATWSGLKYSVAYCASAPFTYGPFLYQLVAGSGTVSKVYNSFRIGDVVYMMTISTSFFTLFEQVNLTLVLRRVIPMEARIRQMKIMWIFVGAVLYNGILTMFFGVAVSTAYAVFTVLAFQSLHHLIPCWCFDKREDNLQKLRLLVVDDKNV